MSKVNFIVAAGLLFSLSSSFSQADEVKSFEKLKSTSLVRSLQELPTIEGIRDEKKNTNDLIHDNMDKKWLKPAPVLEIKNQPFRIENYLEGTGTRGGGSGLLVKKSETWTEVQLLDIFRSENLEQYNLFFPVDKTFRRLENADKDANTAARAVFSSVLQRLSQVAPNLASKILALHEGELSFEKWVPLYSDLPLIDDETPHPLEANKDKIQIAQRRTHYIMYNARAYAAMSPLNRAALWLHEYLYALSGKENSIKVQRAVSLLFSSEFLKIAADEAKLTQLFFDLDLLGLSRKSVEGSLPPGSALATTKQTEYCALLQGMTVDVAEGTLNLNLQYQGQMKVFKLHRGAPEAAIIGSAILWGKIFLTKTYPLFKYPGQKILGDKICFNSRLSKVTQIQVAVAIDLDLMAAVREEAYAEVEYYQAMSAIARTDIIEDPSTRLTRQIEAVDNFQTKMMSFFKKQNLRAIKEITPLEKIMNPQILGAYNIDIKY